MRVALSIMAILGLLAAMSGSAQARTVRLCYDDWPPYAYERDGEASGLAIELVRGIMKKAGHDVTFTQMPVARCRMEAGYRHMDGVLLDGFHPANDAGFLTSTTSLAMRVTVAVVRSSFLKSEYRGPETFKGANWLKVIGYSYPDAIAVNDDMHAVEAAEYAHGFDMLKRHYVDVLLTDITYLRDAPGKRHNIAGLKVLRPAVEITGQYLALLPELDDVMADFDLAMAECLKSGEVDDLYHRYLGFNRLGFARYVAQHDLPLWGMADAGQ